MLWLSLYTIQVLARGSRIGVGWVMGVLSGLWEDLGRGLVVVDFVVVLIVEG